MSEKTIKEVGLFQKMFVEDKDIISKEEFNQYVRVGAGHALKRYGWVISLLMAFVGGLIWNPQVVKDVFFGLFVSVLIGGATLVVLGILVIWFKHIGEEKSKD